MMQCDALGLQQTHLGAGARFLLCVAMTLSFPDAFVGPGGCPDKFTVLNQLRSAPKCYLKGQKISSPGSNHCSKSLNLSLGFNSLLQLASLQLSAFAQAVDHEAVKTGSHGPNSERRACQQRFARRPQAIYAGLDELLNESENALVEVTGVCGGFAGANMQTTLKLSSDSWIARSIGGCRKV